MSSSGPPPVPGGRTPEEREAARREREARRAGRAPVATDGNAASAVPPPTPAARQPPPTPPTPPTPPPPVAPQPVDDWLADEQPPPAPEAAPKAPRRGPRRLLPALVGGAAIVVVAWFLLSLFQPFGGDGGERVRIVVPKGAGVGEIADLLAENDVIASPFFFELRATVTGRRGDLKPGTYTLQQDMSFGDALDALAAGPPLDVVTVTVPEGRSRREIAPLVKNSLEGDYLKASIRNPAINLRRYRAQGAGNLEGFLFPATYDLRRGRPVSELVRQQVEAFEQRFAEVDMRYARSKNLTPYDVVTIASMVEREAQLPRERPLIASVIYNRLREGIPLGIDATLRFELNKWSGALTESELANPSPYNTRVNQNLPPGPIGNPGLDSLKAAARPARTDYLYFVVKPGGNGAHAFASTDAEHERNVQRYNNARDALGGQSPD